MTSSSEDESLPPRQLAYWRAELTGLRQPMELPADHPRPVEKAGDLRDSVLKILNVLPRSHPFTTVRAAEL
ncbi:hypothetical protein, partial [Streptomyces sp. NPDC002690]